MDTNKKMPVLFVGHGSPMNAIEDNATRRAWREMGAYLGKPKAIAAVSAHWYTDGLCVRRSAENPQINDMYGFPDELYRVKYEPAGSIEYADRVLSLLGPDAKADSDWGIDHGIWSVLANMYPDADVPVVMISVDSQAAPREQFETGRRLAPLRDEGVLIAASGNVVHNLRLVNWKMQGGCDWACGFDSRIKRAVLENKPEIVINYASDPDAAKAVPTPDHFYPLLTALGARQSGDTVGVWNEQCELGALSMTSYVFEQR